MTTIQAIDLLKGLEQSLDDYCELNDEGKTAFRMAIAAHELFGNAEQLPSAQPERKKGKWIIKDDTERFIAQCNCCRYIEDSRRIKNFCPNCGADMRGEGEQDG